MGTAVEISKLKSFKDRISFEGKKGFVTGAAGGIGRSVAATLAELGGQVALVDINYEKAAANAEDINSRFDTGCFAIGCDVSRPESVESMMKEAVDKMGEINFVHSNAGIIHPEDSVDMPFDSWEKMVAVNLTGMMLIDQAAGRQMKAQGKGGTVVNTGSMSGRIINNTHGRPGSICYPTTKAGVVHMTRAFAAHYAKDGIRYNCISPGNMYSGIHDGVDEKSLNVLALDSPIGRFGTMDEIGGLVAFLLSDLSTFMVGSDVLIDGGHCIW